MISLGKFLNIFEKIIFVLTVIIVIIIASGYKYDPDKNELIQTGVLKMENIEDNTTLYFNNEKYDNRNNLSVSLLNQNAYSLKIEKPDRKTYLTNINIKQGEVTYINPVLIPNTITPTITKSNAENITANDKSMFYTYSEGNSIFVERFNVNKALFTVDLNKARVDITSFIDKTKKISLISGNTNNFIIINNESKILIIDFNKLSATDITSYLPQQPLLSAEIFNNNILMKYDQMLYSVNISNLPSIERYLVFTGKTYLYTINDNNQIQIIYNDSNNNAIIETYTMNGVLQNKLEAINKQNLTINNDSKFLYFYKNLYLKIGEKLYKLDQNQFVEYQNNVKLIEIIDINNLLIINDSKVLILSKEKQLIYSLSKNIENVDNILIMPDLFTFIYIDNTGTMHLADLGGQDNPILNKVGKNFLASQNGSDTYIVFESKGQVSYMRLGNTK